MVLKTPTISNSLINSKQVFKIIKQKMKFMLQQQQNIKDTYIICASLCITTLITTINPNSDFGFLFLPYYYLIIMQSTMNKTQYCIIL